ncbi:hypothetical protein [Chryseobacterium gwangjuense]|uniref:hypothetical protein n=1 Tax=Chryseobacterium gwangjuense TaxID=1069980 RepID=UPI001E467730|nr:hypothetical protein [Chryseobacterium gwangjuense]MCE3077235.1 hypothetical protein [Chryseobacterium gwangjuense]
MKKILIIMHNYAEIPILIKKNLDDLGYENVDFIFFAEEKFRYKNMAQKVKNLYRKTILKDKSYKDQLRKEFIERTLLEKAEKLPHYDTILMLNTDFFSDEFICIIKTKAKKLVGNHWDGLNRTPAIYSKIKFFDAFYVFDKSDVDEKNNIYFLTNFFFNFNENKNEETIKQDVFYLGTYVEERFNVLKNISKTFTLKNISQKILLFTWNKRDAEGEITFTNQFLSYEENMNHVKSSKALLDLKLKEHNGLSFRFFEALKYHKKLITDNTDVKNYDFYKKENIFIIGEDDEDGLKNFVESPYQEIPSEIKNKYSFENWFKTLIS